ncbi:hypothetical protein CPB83DRAFT_412702 [Crepidotus variabilis]|uniref:1-alkyl-2-acetylglycerophosphocholine esterase n=1 Tax=Crepidotus variabilis TaxID=179855 RepID=A0A9P6EPY8_9AGAR|nr:hypothetical protein CPB83DRAFT_412702 [Crepidotus variabilis]
MFVLHLALLSCAVTALANPPHLTPITGPFKTGVVNLPLTDYSRKDLFAPNNFRKLMVSIYYPTPEHNNNPTSYITPAVASIYEAQLNLTSGSLTTVVANSKKNALPLLVPNSKRVIFSHGGGTSRLIHTALLEDLASYGYVAISIDHPYDANAVQFPDGSVILRDPSNFTTDLLDRWYRQRLDDIYFVDGLTGDFSIICPTVQARTAALVAGHSFGGAAVAGAMIESHRFIGGFNFDGAFWNNSIAGDAVKPFFIMGGSVRIPAGDTSWDTFRAAQTGWNREAIVSGIQHFGFTDFPSLIQALGVPRTQGILDFIGTIAPDRAIQIQRTYVKDFADWRFGKGPGRIVAGPTPQFPEVSFVPPP